MNPKLKGVFMWLVLILLIFCAVRLAINTDDPAENDDEFDELVSDMSHYWACMDGCFNMQELIYGTLNYSDEEMKNLHGACADVCSSQYMGA